MTREPSTTSEPSREAFVERLIPAMTFEQIDSIARKAHRIGMPVEDLIVKVQATIGCDGAVTVPWCGMWLLVERDGYTHS